MANLPAKQNQSSLDPEEEAIRRLLLKGWEAAEIARKLQPRNKLAQRRVRARARRIYARDPQLAGLKGEEAHGLIREAIPDMAEALVRRAKRGRPDAIKLAFEASGFYNPKVQHEHSGDIKITLDLPRPPKRVDADIQDADVIED